MKRILSILLLLILLISSVASYAIDAGTYTQKINTGYMRKVTASTMSNYASESLTGCVVYFMIPLPKLSSGQTLTDCKLYFYTKNNKLETGYNLGAFKLPDGANLIGSGIGLGGMDNAKAVKKFYANYPTTGILDAYIYNETGNDTNPKMVKLTSYYHEIENNNNGYMYIAISILKDDSVAIDMSKSITFEYTVADTKKLSGYGVYDVDLLPEVCDHYNATVEENLLAGANCKAVVKAYNNEKIAKNATLYIATYNDGELETLTTSGIALNPYDSDIMLLSDTFAAPAAGKKVKAFVWAENSATPLTEEAHVYTIAGE